MKDAVRDRAERIVTVLVDAIVLEGVEEMSVAEIARRVGCTAPQATYAADAVFEIDHGWRRIVPTTTYVDVRERNFNTVTHQRKCRGYMVQRTYLAALLKEARCTLMNIS